MINRVGDGLFVLSLVGATGQGNIHKALSFTDRGPDVAFGNIRELVAITGEIDGYEAIKNAFPESKLVVITQAEKGAMIRFEKQVFPVTAKVIPNERFVDEVGAGDAYMGTMLALLLHRNYTEWTMDDIVNAAEVATHAASLIIQSMESAITPAMASIVRRYGSLSS